MSTSGQILEYSHCGPQRIPITYKLTHGLVNFKTHTHTICSSEDTCDPNTILGTLFCLISVGHTNPQLPTLLIIIVVHCSFHYEILA